ncbi:MAG: RpiB/LacA/LacB family sugar-phosphate isomerase [Bacteroidota bacterium]
MKVYFATDHSGFSLKEELILYVRDELGYEVEDCGAYTYEASDDYPDFIKKAAQAVAENPKSCRGIVIGASGQGEAITANRYSGVRAVVFYGEPGAHQTDAAGESHTIISGSREHNDANILSLAARFITAAEAKRSVREWLETPFGGSPRHARRVAKIDDDLNVI